MARQEKFAKPGAKPVVRPATIHEDLRGRDFTINSIALSLNPASRGLLLDPNNGVGDLERKELRSVSNYTLYDDPVRLLRVLRFKVRLALISMSAPRCNTTTLARRSSRRASGARRCLTNYVKSPASRTARTSSKSEEEKLLHLFSPAVEGGKVNIAGLQKLQKAKQMVPFGVDLRLDGRGTCSCTSCSKNFR